MSKSVNPRLDAHTMSLGKMIEVGLQISNRKKRLEVENHNFCRSELVSNEVIL